MRLAKGSKAAVRALAAVGLTLALLAAPALAAAARLSSGAIASPDRYGAQAAREVLKAGGNAADAAVATAFALAVTYPEAGNLGGGGFMTLLIDGKPYFLDYREVAPGLARADMYLDERGEPVAARSQIGVLSAGVPGTVRGMAEVHRRFGKLSWARDLAPAIRLARDGFRVDRQFYDLTAESRGRFDGTNFARHFGAMRAGRLFRQPELARTLMRIAARGADEFYAGRTADMIVAQMTRDGGKGLISRADLAAYKPVWREPLVGRWGEFTVITAPPPSSGGIALLQMLNMKRDRADLFAGVALNSAQYVHLVSEIEKRVFADRAQYMGDPDFVSVPVGPLTDDAYIARRAREIDPARPSALASVQPGLEGARVAAAQPEKAQTTHFSIVDGDGNAVSNTYTLNGWFGSGVVVEGAGFLLNDEMDDFSAKPGTPNMYGVVGADANAIAPHKRPLSSMSPTILTRNGEVAMVIGTPGGSRIFTSVFQVLAEVYDFHLPLDVAQHTARFHHQLLPENTIFTESWRALPAPLAAELGTRGYRLQDQGFNGDIEAIRIEGGRPDPQPDPRARGVGLLIP